MEKRITRAAAVVAIFVTSLFVSGAVSAIGQSVDPQSTDSHDRGDGPENFDLYQRQINSPILGDTWVLEHARGATTWWSNLGITVQLGNGAVGEVTIRDGDASVDLGSVAWSSLDGVDVFLDKAQNRAEIASRIGHEAGDRDAENRALERLVNGDASSRLSKERPTGWDSLDLALAPGYWLRTMVDRFATRVTVVGSEVVAGRPTTVVDIEFASPADEKYGGNGWTWWVDDQTGVLLKYELGAPEDGIPFVFEVTSVDFNPGPLASLPIPAGFVSSILVLRADGVTETSTLPATANERSVAVVIEAASN